MLTRVKPKLVSSGVSRFGFSNFQRHSGFFCYVNHLGAYANPKATRAFAHLHSLLWIPKICPFSSEFTVIL